MPAKTPAKLWLDWSAHTGHNITERKEGRGSDSSLQQEPSVQSFAEIPKLISEITLVSIVTFKSTKMKRFDLSE